MEKNNGELKDVELETFKRLMEALPLTEKQKEDQLAEFLRKREERKSSVKESGQRGIEVLAKLKRSGGGIHDELQRIMGTDEPRPGRGSGKT